MSLVIQDSHDHEVLGQIIIAYSRSTLSLAKGGAQPRWIAEITHA